MVRGDKMKYELATCTWGDEELAAIREVVESGNFTMGGKVAEFERRFADYLGARHCVMVNSGSSANLLMTAALFFRRERRLERGDEVLVPAVSWATTYTPLAQYGLRLRFVDIDLNTLNFDLDALERAISPRTRAVLAVNLLGNSNDYGRISRMLAGRGIDLLEDNCESLGGEWEGRKLGTIGIMGTFSCYFSHHISTMEGGVVATDDDELYHILLSLRSHGWTRNLPDDNLVCSKGSDPFEESFRFVLPGYNVRPVEMSGAVGICQLEKLPRFVETRRRNAERFLACFGDDRRFIVQRELGRSSWFGFSLILRDESVARGKVVAKLRDSGIETRPVVAGNFARKEVVKWFDCEVPGELPNADIVDARGFFVGNNPEDLSSQIGYLKEVLDGVV